MTSLVGAFTLAWALGYVLGYQVRMIRAALHAS